MKLRGKGLIIDAARGVGFPAYGDVEVDFGLGLLKLGTPAAGSASSYDSPLAGSIVWCELTAELLAAVTGDALSYGTLARAEAEPHCVPDGPPYAIDLVGAAAIPHSEVVVGDDNARLRKVAGTPGPGEYAVSGARLTFGAERAGQYVYADYFYADRGSGRTLALSPFAAAGEFKLLAALKLNEPLANRCERELILAAERCRPTGPLPAESGEDEVGAFGFAFAAENRAAGDLTLYFP